jgi:hypothetical protein
MLHDAIMARTWGEIATTLRLSTSTVKRMVRQKRLIVRKDGGTVVLLQSDYLNYIELLKKDAP